MTSPTLLTAPSVATDVAIACPARIGPGTLAHGRGNDRRDSGRRDTHGKPIEVSVLVTVCTRTDAVELSYGWAASLGAILCPQCFPDGGGA